MDTGLSRDVPPYVTASGMPAEPKGINSEGLKRREFDSQQIRNIKNAYKILYRSGLRLEEAIQKLAELVDAQEEIRVLVDFLKASERSIIR